METQNTKMDINQMIKKASEKLTIGASEIEQFYISFNKDLIFQVTVRMIKSQVFIFKAILCYKNLLSVVIPRLYIKTLSDLIKKGSMNQSVQKMVKYYDVNFGAAQLFFQFKGSFFQFKKEAVNLNINVHRILSQIVAGLSNTIDHVSKCLQKIGIIKTQSQNCLDLNKKEFLFKQKMMDILKNLIKLRTQSPVPHEEMDIESQKNNWQIVEKIEQTDAYQQDKNYKFKGGYCQIQKKLCNIYRFGADMEQPQSKILAVKTLNPARRHPRDTTNGNYNYLEKLQNQKRILQHIGKSQYVLNYYEDKNNSQVVYMDYCEYTLSDFNNKDHNTIEEILTISMELVKAVISLHKNDIVHRDLKPSNILLKRDTKQLKIIDFGQSTLVSDQFTSNRPKLGSTVPYSAIQCVSDSQAGYNKKLLDNWSVGINLYELMFKRLPVSYTRNFSKDILKGWQNQLMIPVNKLKKSGLRLLEDAFNIITIKLVKFNPQSRISLQKVLLILQQCQKYMKQVCDFANR